jgi:hypothetical protein
MAVYSVRLAFSTTVTGVLISGAAYGGSWEAPVLLAALLTLLALLSILRTVRLWETNSHIRARVAVTVAGG